MNYDVAIIGAGVTGSALARELSRYDLKIVVIEKENDVSCGTSKANTAIVHAGHDAENGSLKAKFNILGNAMYDKLCEELSVSMRRNSTLVVAFSEEQLPDLEAMLQKGIANGCEGLRIIGKEELHRLSPCLSDSACGALVAPSGGIVSPYDLVIAMGENAVQNGAEFRLATKVETLEKREDLWHIVTNKGDIDARVVVNCAGVYADEINNQVSADKYHITPRRGEYIILDKRNADKFDASICPLPSKMATGHTKGIWIAPTVSGTILLGPTAEDVESKDATENTAFGFNKIMTAIKAMWPTVPTGDFISTYAGLRAHSDRGDFILGEAPDAENFFNCGGIESPGLTAAPAIGVFLAEQVAEKLHAEKKENFDPIRHVNKPFRYMTDEERTAAIARDPDYAKIVCRCEMVTEAEVRESIRRPLGARDMDGVKRRTRAGMGRCQSGFCSTRVIQILSEELGIAPEEVTKFGGNSLMMMGDAIGEERA